MASSSSSSRNAANSHYLTNPPAQTCLCSPTNHPGSFRCSLHKKSQRDTPHQVPSNNRPSKANSWKAILMQIIRPSSHDLHRRKNSQPKATRFSFMNSSTDPLAVS